MVGGGRALVLGGRPPWLSPILRVPGSDGGRHLHEHRLRLRSCVRPDRPVRSQAGHRRLRRLRRGHVLVRRAGTDRRHRHLGMVRDRGADPHGRHRDRPPPPVRLPRVLACLRLREGGLPSPRPRDPAVPPRRSRLRPTTSRACSNVARVHPKRGPRGHRELRDQGHGEPVRSLVPRQQGPGQHRIDRLDLPLRTRSPPRDLPRRAAGVRSAHTLRCHDRCTWPDLPRRSSHLAGTPTAPVSCDASPGSRSERWPSIT